MSGVVLDASQVEAVEVEASTRQIVIAGPGSGKTEVVSSLIENLVHGEGVEESDGIVVISFSNAAVHAADARLKRRDIGPVPVQTMDSLAGEIIRDLWDGGSAGMTFERRIELATQLLVNEGWDRLDDLEHLVVDEVQDVVGVRADFLLALLGRLPDHVGFSLLGDPAQGIYDWQISDGSGSSSKTTSLEMLSQIRAMRAVTGKELTGQYRAISRDARRVVELRGAVLDAGAGSPLERFFGELVAVESIDDAVRYAKVWTGKTAFLTSNNGQALLAARSIAEMGVRAEVRRSAHQRVLADWIARLLFDLPTSGITREELDDRASALFPDADPAALWRSLRSVSGGVGREIDLASLAQGLRRRRPIVPDLIQQPSAALVVSTVHRAKGLEFDNVVYLDFPGSAFLATSESFDERQASRELFVALSRARDIIVRAAGPDDRFLRSVPPRGEAARRWYLGGPRKWMTFGFELRVDDLDRLEPPGHDRAATQRYIADVMRPGDPLQLVLDLSRSTLKLPIWEVSHGNHVVGRTSTTFGEAFCSRAGSREKKAGGWPALTGAHVESVVTVAGDPQPGGVGRHGLWLAPICAGMLRIDWNGENVG